MKFCLYSLTNAKLKAEITSRRAQLRRHENKAELVELVIADILRIRAVAHGARSSGAMSVDPARSSGAMRMG